MNKEKFEKIKAKTKEVLLKVKDKMGRRSIAAICAVLLIGCAVVLNVILFRETDPSVGDGDLQMAVDLTDIDGEPSKDDTDDAGSDEVELDGEDYFATVSLGRQQARDEAMEVLLEVTENESALAEAKASAMADINRIALDIEKEGNIEAMVTARGFEKCVAVVNGDSASVVVSCDTLTPGQTAQISEIVYEAAGIHPANLKIIEKSLS